jgi:molecular chaperone DnaK
MTSRMTIDFGIDLGTTNSTIAVIDGPDATVIPNKKGSTVTPSAVHIDSRGRLRVGEDAKEYALTTDWDNGDIEFKLRMGLGDVGKKVFVHSGREMRPEELSAEVLKSLKTDARANMQEEVRAAVITVPAAFELPSIQATAQAAELAGFEVAPILLEPVAASLAYGLQKEGENAYWFVYDFGGGTFDAALMRVRDGIIQVANHNGDNHLGGKLIDWDLVTKLLVPSLAQKYNLPDFGRGSARWSQAMWRLKKDVEIAKIDVCRTREEVEIHIPRLCDDADGHPVEVVYTLTPNDIEEISRPYIARSLGLCKRTLEEKGLSPASLDRVLMVGGSTLNPWMREAVERELGARLDFGIDPVTVVARGAAIYAGTQTLPIDHSFDAPVGTWRVDIDMKPAGDDPEPDIGGRVHAEAGQSVIGFTIEFRDKKTRWSTGTIPLHENGVFMTQLYVEQPRRSEFELELLDPTGRRIPIIPDTIHYSYGDHLIELDAPCPKSIGIGLSNGKVARFISKGKALPARGSMKVATTVALRAGHQTDHVRIPVVEGEHPKTERNHPIGELILKGTDLERDLPKGSTVELTVKLDRSMKVQVFAFVEHVDEDFEIEFDLKMTRKSLPDLGRDFALQTERLQKVKGDPAASHPDLAAPLERISREDMVAEIESLFVAAEQDVDALSQLDRRLLDLAAALDAAEDALSWPKSVDKAEEKRLLLQDTIEGFESLVTDSDRERARAVLADLQRGIENRDESLVRRCTEDLAHLSRLIWERNPYSWKASLDYLEENLDQMTVRSQAQRLISDGRRAIELDNLDALKLAVRQLRQLLPFEHETPLAATQSHVSETP